MQCMHECLPEPLRPNGKHNCLLAPVRPSKRAIRRSALPFRSNQTASKSIGIWHLEKSAKFAWTAQKAVRTLKKFSYSRQKAFGVMLEQAQANLQDITLIDRKLGNSTLT
jgi:hypothetical protein